MHKLIDTPLEHRTKLSIIQVPSYPSS